MDVNLQGHLAYLRARLRHGGFDELLDDPVPEYATFPNVGLPNETSDRRVWEFCQAQGWALLTDNRNDDGPDSLEAVLRDSWRPGSLPVLTVADKRRFERDSGYADRVAEGVAEVLFGLTQEGKYRDRPREFVPLK